MSANIPPQFLCPVTNQVFKECYVSVECGHRFEKEAILALFLVAKHFSRIDSIHGEPVVYCPCDHTPLTPSKLVPDPQFQNCVTRWLQTVCNPLPFLGYFPQSTVQHQFASVSDEQNTTITDAAVLPLDGVLHSFRQMWTDGGGCQKTSNVSQPLLFGKPVSVPFMSTLPRPTSLSAVYPEKKTRKLQISADAKKAPKTTMDAKKFKTRLCRSWLKNQKCRFGKSCFFAHGTAELSEELADTQETPSSSSCASVRPPDSISPLTALGVLMQAKRFTD